ncbi:MAG: hypothetical protein R2741_05475 [Methanolobus sp.]
MKQYLKMIAGVFLVLVLLAIMLGPLVFIRVEPLYSVENQDIYPHNVTVKVDGYKAEYKETSNYELNPGESVEFEKPLNMLLKWSNPFKEGYLYHASGDYLFVLESENKSASCFSVPHKSNTVLFELKNESGNFSVSVVESDDLRQQLRKSPLDILMMKKYQ